MKKPLHDPTWLPVIIANQTLRRICSKNSFIHLTGAVDCVAWHTRESSAEQIPLRGGAFISSLTFPNNTESCSGEVGHWGKWSWISLFSLLFLTHWFLLLRFVPIATTQATWVKKLRKSNETWRNSFCFCLHLPSSPNATNCLIGHIIFESPGYRWWILRLFFYFLPHLKRALCFSWHRQYITEAFISHTSIHNAEWQNPWGRARTKTASYVGPLRGPLPQLSELSLCPALPWSFSLSLATSTTTDFFSLTSNVPSSEKPALATHTELGLTGPFSSSLKLLVIVGNYIFGGLFK